MRKFQKKRSDDVGGMVFVGFILLGLALGLLYLRPDTGVLAGLGAGFIGYALVKLKIRD